MMGRGVFAGTSTPYQLLASKPGSPASATVGRSGNSAERLAVLTAIPLILPAFICGTAVAAVANTSCMLPATRSIIAGPPPLYGTCTILVPAMVLNNSSARCPVPPTPEEPPLSDLLLASAIISFTDLTGTDGCSTSTLVESTASVTGEKSLIGSKGSLP